MMDLETIYRFGRFPELAMLPRWRVVARRRLRLVIAEEWYWRYLQRLAEVQCKPRESWWRSA